MKKLILSLLISTSLVSCEEEEKVVCEPTPQISTDLMIKSGEICGWCAKNDTLEISSQKAHLKTYENCDSLATDVSANLTAQEWNELRSTLDIPAFTALNLNSCAICYDGCDRWITIQNDTLYHHIRYERGDTAAVQSIEDFVEALDELTNSLSN